MNIYQTFKLLTLRKKFQNRNKWTREELEQHRNRALSELREYAYANSPFYQKFHNGLFDAPLQELPVLIKAELMKHWNEIITDKSIRFADVQNFMLSLKEPKMFENKYYIASTGGSSGLKGIFIYNPEEWMQVLLSYFRANDWAGLKFGLTKKLKIAFVTTLVPWHQSSVVGATVKNRLVPTLRVDSTEPIESKVAKLNDFQPESLVAYVREAKVLAKEQIVGNLNIFPKVVFCSSEVLTDEVEIVGLPP